MTKERRADTSGTKEVHLVICENSSQGGDLLGCLEFQPILASQQWLCMAGKFLKSAF